MKIKVIFADEGIMDDERREELREFLIFEHHMENGHVLSLTDEELQDCYNEASRWKVNISQPKGLYE